MFDKQESRKGTCSQTYENIMGTQVKLLACFWQAHGFMAAEMMSGPN